ICATTLKIKGLWVKCLSRGHGRNVARYGANVRRFYAVTGRQIDPVWGWNGNSAAKVVHFRPGAWVLSSFTRNVFCGAPKPAADITSRRNNSNDCLLNIG